jgi:signal transduction histidine kinase
MTGGDALPGIIAVLAPIGRDATASVELLGKAGMEARAFGDIAALVENLSEATGAVFVAEEALFNADCSALCRFIGKQPPWSDLPIVVLTSHVDRPKIAAWRQQLVFQLQNVSFLERPVQPITLVSALKVALRARSRQIEVRSLLEARERAAQDLEAQVIARTQQLEAVNTELVNLIAERQRVEESLRQSQKMEAVGQLTGGLAHDFNNLLAGIGGSLELTKSRMSQGRIDEVDRYITAAQSAVKRAAALTHRLLAFSRRQTLDPKPTNVNKLVADMEEFIGRTIGPSIRMEVVGSAGLWSTLVDPNQLENALLNLCLNARDAMPDGGQLTIETANKWLDERAALDRDLPRGQYVSLCVTDTGTGMPPDIVARIFDPFFTTKPLGEGTGLGLSMIYGFARQSGGQVRVYSEVGKGTTMCIYLPRYQDGDTESDEALSPSAPIEHVGDGQVVLVIDDEPTLRMLIAEVLGDAGYTAIEASDGKSALRVLESTARIDLMITDVGLPNGLNGRQVADAARLLRPDLKVVFITGYAENATLGHGRLEKGMQVLAKPFPMEVLARRVREILQSG